MRIRIRAIQLCFQAYVYGLQRLNRQQIFRTKPISQSHLNAKALTLRNKSSNAVFSFDTFQKFNFVPVKKQKKMQL